MSNYVKMSPVDTAGSELGGAPATTIQPASVPATDATQQAPGSPDPTVSAQVFNIDDYINNLPTDGTVPAAGSEVPAASGNEAAFASIATQLQQQTQVNQQLMQSMQSMQQAMQQGLATGPAQQQQGGLNDVLQSLATNQQTLTQALAGQNKQDQDWMTPEQRIDFAKSAPIIENAAKHFSQQTGDRVTDQMTNKMTQEFNSRDERIDALSEQLKQSNFNTFKMQVRQSHGDLQTVLDDPNWTQFKAEIDPLSGFSRGELFHGAVSRSDAQTANNILDAYKTKYGSQQQAAGANQFGVPGQQGNPAQNLGEQGQTQFVRGQDAEMLAKWQSKQMSDEVFDKLFAAYEKAESAGLLIDRR